MHSAEVAVAKAQAAADEKRKVEKEVAEIKTYKSFLERNEEVYKLAIAVVAKALKNGNLNAAAMGLAQANAATGQIKPLSDSNQPDKDDKPGIDRAIEIMKARNDARQRAGS